MLVDWGQGMCSINNTGSKRGGFTNTRKGRTVGKFAAGTSNVGVEERWPLRCVLVVHAGGEHRSLSCRGVCQLGGHAAQVLFRKKKFFLVCNRMVHVLMYDLKLL